MKPALLLAALLLTFAQAWAQPAPTQPALRDELIALYNADQAARTSRDAKATRATDDANRARLKAIVAKDGWPTLSMVGVDGAHAAWVIAQHADPDPAFQRRVLALMEPLVAKGEASGKLYAYLYDRLHKPQRYGTQGSCTGKGTWVPREIEDPAGVDARRAALKMVPEKLADYAQLVAERSCAAKKP